MKGESCLINLIIVYDEMADLVGQGKAVFLFVLTLGESLLMQFSLTSLFKLLLLNLISAAKRYNVMDEISFSKIKFKLH